MLFFCFLIILNLLLFLFPKEISLLEDRIIYKTIAVTKSIPFSDIKDIKQIHTTRSVIMAGGDKNKGTVLFAILLNKPYKFILFGGSISEYQSLYTELKKIMGQRNRGQANRE